MFHQFMQITQPLSIQMVFPLLFISVLIKLLLSTKNFPLLKMPYVAAIIVLIFIIIVLTNNYFLCYYQVGTFTSAAGQSGWSSIHSKAQDVESSIAKSVQLCSATSILTPYNFHEESELHPIFAKLSSNLASTLTSFQSKKAEFSAISVVPLVKTDIENWFNQTNSLDNYLIKRTAANSLPTVNGYINQIVSSFQSAIAAYKA